VLAAIIDEDIVAHYPLSYDLSQIASTLKTIVPKKQ